MEIFTTLQPYLRMELFGNTAFQYLETLGIAIVIWCILLVFRSYERRKARKLQAHSQIFEVFVQTLRSFSVWWYLWIGLSISGLILDVYVYVRIAFLIVLSLFGIFFFQKFANSYIESTQAKSQRKDVALTGIKIFFTLVIWISGILLILSNLGVKITALITSLGVVGVAVAFSLQNILADIFSSFSIFFDKPFQYGDLISIGGETGTIKKIGIKTTRIQTSRGEELIVPNKDLTNSRLFNFRRMEKRKITFTLSLQQKTPLEKLKKVPEIIKNCMLSLQDIEFDRAHFKAFSDSGLIFEVAYAVKSNDYTLYMNAQQEINFAIYECFEKEGIKMTNTVNNE